VVRVRCRAQVRIRTTIHSLRNIDLVNQARNAARASSRAPCMR
jgi:hypothetical protein